MIIVCNRIPVNEANQADFEQAFATRAGLVDDMDGFIAFQLLRPVKPTDPYIVMTFWETQAHFDAWVGSPEFKKGHARVSSLPKGTMLGHPVLELYERTQATFDIVRNDSVHA